MTLDEIVERYGGRAGKGLSGKQPTPITYMGVTYPSVSEFIRENNLIRSSSAQAIRYGMPLEKVIERYKITDSNEEQQNQVETADEQSNEN